MLIQFFIVSLFKNLLLFHQKLICSDYWKSSFFIYRNRYCLKVLDNIFVQSAYFKGVLIHLNLRFIKSYSFEPKKILLQLKHHFNEGGLGGGVTVWLNAHYLKFYSASRRIVHWTTISRKHCLSQYILKMNIFVHICLTDQDIYVLSKMIRLMPYKSNFI